MSNPDRAELLHGFKITPITIKRATWSSAKYHHACGIGITVMAELSTDPAVHPLRQTV
jgi:hypothetical protein